MLLDEVFEQKNDIAKAVSEELEKVSFHQPVEFFWCGIRVRKEKC